MPSEQNSEVRPSANGDHSADGDMGLVINKPYECPDKHWDIDSETGWPVQVPGRRISEYRILPSGSAAKSAKSSNSQLEMEQGQQMLPGQAHRFELVEQLRSKLIGWRRNGYPEATPVSKRLLQHWTASDRNQPLFFCQVEAAETFIYLAETRDGAKIAKTIKSGGKGDGGPFERWCAKMATGTGKTVVMAMLIAWQTLNHHHNPGNPDYSRSFLAVTPGLTVKDRLSVLAPGADGNYYDIFSLLPPGQYREILQAHARILVVNWHKLMWQTDEEIKKRKGVDKRGALSDRAWTHFLFDGRLPENEPIAVINDEAHHAWRLPPDLTEDAYLQKDIKEATRWIQGLDRLHKSVGISRCYDFTATPFIPAGKRGQTGERMFGWVVSDFGLNDSIEAGIVKTPRIPRRDNTTQNGNGDPRLPDSYLYHIYSEEGVREDLRKKKGENVRLPDKVVDAYRLLSDSWKETFDSWQSQGAKSPPVMVSIANITHTAARIHHWFTEQGEAGIAALEDADTTLHIDSTVLKKAEQNDQTGKAKETGEALREKVKTVGVAGAAGGDVRHVISVEMLSEGWDAKNVTHIMGLRAFTSQLLCEQVIGRGLRRTDYKTNEHGMLEPEYVRVFGVPFVFMLQQEDPPDQNPKPPAPPPERIHADHAKKSREIWFPDIERVDHLLNETIAIGVADIEALYLDGDDVVREASVHNAMSWLQTEDGEQIESKVVEGMRTQTLAFRAAAQVCAEQPAFSQNLLMSSQLADLTMKFAASRKLHVSGDAGNREVVIKHRMHKVATHVSTAITEHPKQFNKETALKPVYRDPHNPVRSTSEMMPWGTRADKSKLYSDPKKCHLNIAVCDSDLERKVARTLDRHRNVKAWVKNDREHTGFRVRYAHKGITRDYIPDFIVHLEDDRKVIVEAKGVAEDEAASKQRHLDWWIQAVNSEQRWGDWQNFGMIFEEDIPRLKALLDAG